jgi:hypothetical protein
MIYKIKDTMLSRHVFEKNVQVEIIIGVDETNVTLIINDM